MKAVLDSDWSAGHVAGHMWALSVRGGDRPGRGSVHRDRPWNDRYREQDLPEEGTMTMTKRTERPPRSPDQLGQLADFYDTHDTSPEMEDSQWVDPQPMATTSLRLPADGIDRLKLPLAFNQSFLPQCSRRSGVAAEGSTGSRSAVVGSLGLASMIIASAMVRAESHVAAAVTAVGGIKRARSRPASPRTSVRCPGQRTRRG